MSEKESLKMQSADNFSDPDKCKGQVPYENIVSQVVSKIKNEPFLFVIAIVALIIGLVVLAVKLGSLDTRFIIVIIALLVFVVILGHYIQTSLKEKWGHEERLQKVELNKSRDTNETRDELKSVANPKYTINVDHSTGVAAGDNAKLEQHFGSDSRSSIPITPTVEAFTSQENTTALDQQLSRHQENLKRLQAKMNLYAKGSEERLRLMNQIKVEENEIKRIQM
jgi:hypothetical protein